MSLMLMNADLRGCPASMRTSLRCAIVGTHAWDLAMKAGMGRDSPSRSVFCCRSGSRLLGVAGIVLALLVALPEGSSAREPSASPVSLGALRKAVLANEAKAALIRMEYKVSYEESGGPPPSLTEIEAGVATHSHSVYAQDGVRVHHTTSDYADAKWLRGWVSVVDGEVHKRSILPDLMWGRIDRIETFSWPNVCPSWLGFRLFKYRLSELLVPAHASVQQEHATVGGRQAAIVKIEYPGQKAYALVWMDLERGMPLRIERYYSDGESGEYYRGGLVEAIKLHQLPNGGWIPVQGIGRQHIKKPDFELRNVLRVVVDVNSISIDKKDIPDSLFDIQFPPGAKVENGIVGVVVPGDLHLESLSRELLPLYSTVSADQDYRYRERLPTRSMPTGGGEAGHRSVRGLAHRPTRQRPVSRGDHHHDDRSQVPRGLHPLRRDREADGVGENPHAFSAERVRVCTCDPCVLKRPSSANRPTRPAKIC